LTKKRNKLWRQDVGAVAGNAWLQGEKETAEEDYEQLTEIMEHGESKKEI
jgi:hypothetical protein